MEPLPVGVIGYGYWGPNLVRNLLACPQTTVAAVCELSAVQRAAAMAAHGVPTVETIDALLDLPMAAVVIATPVATHYDLVRRCLEAGKDVLVEKPLAASLVEAQTLVDLADRLGRVLMVDHTYVFSNAIRRMRELVQSGDLGDIYYVDSVRINLGLFQSDVNVIWDLAPHDLSIVDYVLGRQPRSISGWGSAHADPRIEDIAYVNVDYSDRFMANFHVSWFSPIKVRRMILTGSRKSLIFDELNSTEPVKVYDRGIEVRETPEDVRRLRVDYRTGDMWSPHVEPGEALRTVVTHFAECVRERSVPISDGRMGVRVVRLLEAATRSTRAQGGRVVLSLGEDNHVEVHAGPIRPGEVHSRSANGESGAKRGHSRVCQPVRLPGG